MLQGPGPMALTRTPRPRDFQRERLGEPMTPAFGRRVVSHLEGSLMAELRGGVDDHALTLLQHRAERLAVAEEDAAQKHRHHAIESSVFISTNGDSRA